VQLALDRPAERLATLRTAWPFALVAVAGAVVLAKLADDVGERDGATRLDPHVADWFAAHRTHLLDSLGLTTASLTAPAVLVALVVVAAGILWWRRARVASVVLLGATFVAYAATAVGKLGEHRARPTAPYNLSPETEPSFPSGHVAVAATVASVAVLLAWRHLSRAMRAGAVVVATAFVLVVCVDRLVVGAHWFTDVVASLALAAAVFGLAAIAERLLRPPA
jgi:membrane-associated phospholipid phosphatase